MAQQIHTHQPEQVIQPDNVCNTRTSVVEVDEGDGSAVEAGGELVGESTAVVVGMGVMDREREKGEEEGEGEEEEGEMEGEMEGEREEGVGVGTIDVGIIVMDDVMSGISNDVESMVTIMVVVGIISGSDMDVDNCSTLLDGIISVSMATVIFTVLL